MEGIIRDISISAHPEGINTFGEVFLIIISIPIVIEDSMERKRIGLAKISKAVFDSGEINTM
mgnify:CR=1